MLQAVFVIGVNLQGAFHIQSGPTELPLQQHLQGVFIFCFHCARSAAVRSEWKSVVSKVTTHKTSSFGTLSASTDTRLSNSDLQSSALRIGLPVYRISAS